MYGNLGANGVMWFMLTGATKLIRDTVVATIIGTWQVLGVETS